MSYPMAYLTHSHSISYCQVSGCWAHLSLTGAPAQLQKHVSLGNITDPLKLTHREGEIKKNNHALQIFGHFPLGI